MSATNEALMQQLLTAREGGGSVAGLLADHEDPTVRMLAQMMAVREAEAQVDAANETARAESAEPEEANRGARLEAADLEHEALLARLEEQRTEIRRLRRINDVLAAALGACPVCWGEEPGCDVCDGEGEPGWEVPERRLFLRLVRPALAQAQPKPETATRRPVHLVEVAPAPDRIRPPERRDR